MSLTSQLDDTKSSINQWFDEHLSNTAPIGKEWNETVKTVPVRRPQTDRSVPSTVGTAFDYRARYHFASTPLEDLVAGTGMRLLDRSRTRTQRTRAAPDGFLDLYGPPPKAAEPAIAILERFRDGLAETLDRLAPQHHTPRASDEALLCRYCYVLGWFEELYRAGLAIHSPLYTLSAGASLDDLLALPEALWIDDICQLSATFASRFAELRGKRIVLNPLFSGSSDIGGADADLIVDGCLIDIKTIVDPKFAKRRLLYQLLGYVLLDYEDEYGIDAVAVYLSRQGLLARFDLSRVLSTLSGGASPSLKELRSSFRQAIQRTT